VANSILIATMFASMNYVFLNEKLELDLKSFKTTSEFLKALDSINVLRMYKYDGSKPVKLTKSISFTKEQIQKMKMFEDNDSEARLTYRNNTKATLTSNKHYIALIKQHYYMIFTQSACIVYDQQKDQVLYTTKNNRKSYEELEKIFANK
jgi:hypothetical protein